MRNITRQLVFTFIIVFASFSVYAGDVVIEPPTKGWPHAFPIIYEDNPVPPNALLLPKNPSYVTTLPGFLSGTPHESDVGKKVPKHDGIVIKGSTVTKGKAIIPPGGLVYMDDTWRGMLPMTAEQMFYFGEGYYFINFVETIRVKRDVELKPGERITVGDHWFKYVSAPGFEANFADVAIQSGTIHGVDWAWAGLSPAVLPIGEDNWFSDKFTLAYNQGKAKEVSRQKVVFDYISGTHYDNVTVAKNRVFKGSAKNGDTFTAGKYTVKITDVDSDKQSFKVQIIENGKVAAQKTLGPVISYDRLIEDSAVRENLVIVHDDVAVGAFPWPDMVENGKANINIFSDVMIMESGMDWPGDDRFAYYPMACPIGHYFGAAIVNKKPIVLSDKKSSVEGPQGYFKIVIDEIGDGKLAWHVEDKAGNKSVSLGGANAENIDLILGKGRAVSGLMTMLALDTLQTMYNYLKQK